MPFLTDGWKVTKFARAWVCTGAFTVYSSIHRLSEYSSVSWRVAGVTWLTAVLTVHWLIVCRMNFIRSSRRCCRTSSRSHTPGSTCRRPSAATTRSMTDECHWTKNDWSRMNSRSLVRSLALTQLQFPVEQWHGGREYIWPKQNVFLQKFYFISWERITGSNSTPCLKKTVPIYFLLLVCQIWTDFNKNWKERPGINP